MLEVALVFALSLSPPIPLGGQGAVLVQASPGPSKTGFYVVDLTCPVENGDLIVVQMNQHGQTTRTKGAFVDGDATDVTIEAAEKQGGLRICVLASAT